MRNLITLFFLLGIISVSIGQNAVIDKSKTTVQKSVFQKDTVKKNNVLFFKQEISQDTLIFNPIKLKFYKKDAHASYYADMFNGRKTASGVKFDNSKYSAAHRKFPFGTKLKITNQASGKSIIVTVNDRGPFSRGREIDLSKKAFMDIAKNKGAGVMIVTIEEVIE